MLRDLEIFPFSFLLEGKPHSAPSRRPTTTDSGNKRSINRKKKRANKQASRAATTLLCPSSSVERCSSKRQRRQYTVMSRPRRHRSSCRRRRQLQQLLQPFLLVVVLAVVLLVVAMSSPSSSSAAAAAAAAATAITRRRSSSTSTAAFLLARTYRPRIAQQQQQRQRRAKSSSSSPSSAAAAFAVVPPKLPPFAYYSDSGSASYLGKTRGATAAMAASSNSDYYEDEEERRRRPRPRSSGSSSSGMPLDQEEGRRQRRRGNAFSIEDINGGQRITSGRRPPPPPSLDSAALEEEGGIFGDFYGEYGDSNGYVPTDDDLDLWDRQQRRQMEDADRTPQRGRRQQPATTTATKTTTEIRIKPVPTSSSAAAAAQQPRVRPKATNGDRFLPPPKKIPVMTDDDDDDDFFLAEEQMVGAPPPPKLQQQAPTAPAVPPKNPENDDENEGTSSSSSPPPLPPRIVAIPLDRVVGGVDRRRTKPIAGGGGGGGRGAFGSVVRDDEVGDAAVGPPPPPTLEDLERQLDELKRDVYRENNGKEFNINSPAQVAAVLFGPDASGAMASTEKSVLEAKAASGHRISDLVLQYRALVQQIRRTKRRKTNVEKGRQVTNAASVVRETAKVANTNDDADVSNATHPSTQEVPTDPLMLVDASSYIFRAYYSMPPIHRSDGMPTGAVMGVCNMLNRLVLDQLVNGERPRFVLVFDAKGKTFRHDLYPAYKQNRPEAPVDLSPQFPLVYEVARAYGISAIEARTYEADDVIATLSKMALQEGIDVNIFTGDKDLMQLVTDKGSVPSCQIIDPATMSRVTYDEVVERWGVPPSQLGDVLALAGDSADNIPGVPGIGPKIAAQLVQEFGTLDHVLGNASSIKQKARREKLEQFRDQALLSRVLVQLREDIPFEQMTFPDGVDKVGDLRVSGMDTDRVLAFYDAMGFQETKRRFLNAIRRSKNQKPASRPNNTRKGGNGKASIPKPGDYEEVPF